MAFTDPDKDLTKTHSPHGLVPLSTDPEALKISDNSLAHLVSPSTQSQEPSHKAHLWGELRLLSPEEVPGRKSKSASLNQALTEAWNRGGKIGWIVAKMRCEVFKLGHRAYAERNGYLAYSTLHSLEHQREVAVHRFNPITVQLLMKGWDKLANELNDQRTDQLVQEAKRELLLALTERYGDSFYGVLSRWRYEVGPEAFAEATGISYGTLWNRHRYESVTDFSELLRYARGLGFIRENEAPREILRNSRVKELRNGWIHDSLRRGRPAALASLHIMLATAGLSIDIRSLGKEGPFKLHNVTIYDLAHFNFIPWKRISSAFSWLRDKGLITEEELQSTRAEWRREYANRPKRSEDILLTKMSESGLSTSRLAEALGIDSREVERPSNYVFRALRYAPHQPLSPIGVLAHLIIKEDKELNRLLSRKRREIVAARRRFGSIYHSVIATERELWGIDYPQLPFPKREIQSLEWGQPSQLSEAEVLNEIKRQGDAKARAALSNLMNSEDTSTIRSAFTNIYNLQGAVPLQKLTSISIPVLQSYARGTDVPSLPRLKEFLEKTGNSLSASLERDWQRQNASCLGRLCASDIERVIQAHIAERANSRHDLLNQGGFNPNHSQRLFNSIRRNGAVHRQDIPTLLDLLGVDKTSPRGAFMAAVLETGRITTGLREFIATRPERTSIHQILSVESLLDPAPTQPAQSLGALRAARRGEVPGNWRQQEEWKLFQFFPGVTMQELRHAAGLQVSPEIEAYAECLTRCGARHISERAIVFAGIANLPERLRSAELLSNLVRQQIPSPALPLGVIAHLAAKDIEEAKTLVDSCREATKAHLELSGLDSSRIAVELRLWGLHPEDLFVSLKELQKAIVFPDSPASAPTLRAVQAAGEQKLKRALSRLIQYQGSIWPKDLFRIAAETINGGEVALSRELGLPFGMNAAILSGTANLQFQRYANLVALLELPLSAALRQTWRWSFAQVLRDRGAAPLYRAIMGSIPTDNRRIVHTGEQSAATVDSPKTPRGYSVEERIIFEFLHAHGLPPSYFKRRFRRARELGTIDDRDRNSLMKALSISETSSQRRFIEACDGARSMTDAILTWALQHRPSSPNIVGFMALAQHLKERQSLLERARQQPTSLSVPELFEHAHHTRELELDLSGVAIRTAHILVGATPDEIIDAAAEYHDHPKRLANLSRAEWAAATLNGAPSLSKLDRWEITPVMISKPLRQRLELLSERLASLPAGSRQQAVSREDLATLLPEYADDIVWIHDHCSAASPWLLASLMYYRDPERALQVLIEELQAGREPRHSGPKHLQFHRDWAASRTAQNLTLLSEATLKGYFDERFEAPGPYEEEDLDDE